MRKYAGVAEPIEFFFDFLSPFSYLVHCRLPGLADRYDRELVYKPFNMIAAKHAAGNTGPATPLIPVKFRYICTDLRRWAEKYGVPLDMPWAVTSDATREELENINLPHTGLDTSCANKAMFYALDRGQGRAYADRIWGGSFASGGLVGSEELLVDVARQLGWSPDVVLDFVRSEEAEKCYQENNSEAQRRGVFGSPTMLVGDDMWWGNDRLELLEEYLNTPGTSA